ncbi:MAG TPA: DUF362 domain-containing protein [Gemmataceae bacterium]|nr:DUF362 domain-containing protein [Gemmataceae bacterium]
MSITPQSGCCGITRRGFLVGAAAGLAAGVPLTWLGLRGVDRLRGRTAFTGRTREVEKPAFGMPGRFPGRVVEVRHPSAVDARHRIDRSAVNLMVDRGMTALTGADDPRDAWRSFFQPGDVVGIKVNPVGRKPIAKDNGGRVPGAVGSISSPELVLKVVEELKNAGIPGRDIVVFERYAEEFVDAGYADLMRERIMDGVRWHASAAAYDERQVDIAGFDRGRANYSPELARHVVGYDPDVFVSMGFAAPAHDPRDDRSFRTHQSLIVTRMVSKIITLPVLKDHRSAGVTLSLKNLSHGMNNNVARSHLPGFHHGGVARGGHPPLPAGPNQCNTFIPTAVNQEPLRRKAVLHILDGLIGVYEGGPGCWNRSWATWRHQGLFFATDPVALDHVGWDVIDAKRLAEGWPSVAHMGLLHELPPDKQMGRASEVFDRRQPEHVILAGTLGLGRFAADQIEHRLISLAKS